MALKVYNTLIRQKEEFKPSQAGKVGMYVCGPTVYNYIHIGNARCYLAFDVIKRYFEFKGYEVFHVQNYTDIDDKIIARAQEENQPTEEIAKKYRLAFEEDMKQLGVLPTDKYPKATEHLTDMIRMIEVLIERGHAYQIDGDVFFSVTSFKDYGKLSHRTLEDMRAGERVEVDPRKHHPMDFALWKKAKPGEPRYPSPWGEGRPGWHIECSAMSLKYLGMSFDIHGGGQDLIFPHHENEIAQSEGYAGSEPFVRYWLHNGFVNIGEEKMAKSVGNIVLVREILSRYEPVALRVLFLGTHWRSPISFTEDNLAEAQEKYNRLLDVLINIDHELQVASRRSQVASQRSEVRGQRSEGELIPETEKKFVEAMDDDFNAAAAFASLFELGHTVSLQLSALSSQQLVEARELLIKLGAVLGLDLPSTGPRLGYTVKPAPIAEIKQSEEKLFASLAKKIEDFKLAQAEPQSRRDRSLDLSSLESDLKEIIEALIALRERAREEKNWQMADLIRSRLFELGIVIEDRPGGTRWRLK